MCKISVFEKRANQGQTHACINSLYISFYIHMNRKINGK